MNHTPTPRQFWTSNSVKRITSVANNLVQHDGDVLHACKHGNWLDLSINDADMKFLITAVNAHDELVAALKDIQEIFFAGGRSLSAIERKAVSRASQALKAANEYL